MTTGGPSSPGGPGVLDLPPRSSVKTARLLLRSCSVVALEQPELVAVRVGQGAAVDSRGSQRHESLDLAASVAVVDEVEPLPERRSRRLHGRASPADLRSSEGRLDRGLLVV